jgi:hypothetical protein
VDVVLWENGLGVEDGILAGKFSSELSLMRPHPRNIHFDDNNCLSSPHHPAEHG